MKLQTTIKLTDTQIDEIVLQRLQQDFHNLKTVRDRFDTNYENDFFVAVKQMIRYNMTESEYIKWEEENS